MDDGRCALLFISYFIFSFFLPTYRYQRQKNKMKACGLAHLVYLVEGGPQILYRKVNDYEIKVKILQEVTTFPLCNFINSRSGIR